MQYQINFMLFILHDRLLIEERICYSVMCLWNLIGIHRVVVFPTVLLEGETYCDSEGRSLGTSLNGGCRRNRRIVNLCYIQYLQLDLLYLGLWAGYRMLISRISFWMRLKSIELLNKEREILLKAFISMD